TGEYETTGGRMPYEEFQEFERVLGRMGQEIKLQVMQIRDAEKRYRHIFENAMEGIFQSSGDGGRLLSINPALARMLGYDSPEEMMSQENSRAMDFYADSRRREDLLNRLRKDGYANDFEVQLVRRDKQIIWVSFDARAVFDQNGELQLVEGFIRDITQRKQVEAEKKQLESQLRHSQKMEAIGTLSGGVAHEFNNMLGIILGNVELALDDIPKDNPASDFLSEIRKASLRGTEIVQQLLRFSRQKDQPLKALDLGPLIKEALGFLRVSIPTVIEFEVKMPEQCWPIVGDPTQIHQVMINLCTNSAHAMEGEGGTLTVSLENIAFETSEVFFDQELPPGRYVALKISDTGCGIDPGCLDRIFEPFFSTKDVGQGTGMGMAVVHGIMKGHHGGVRVSSQEGVGTTVECCFPSNSEGVAATLELAPSVKGGNESILCVDDEESIGRITQKQLERLGYRVEMETQPLEALEMIEKDPQRFDLVITDLIMPKLRGDRLLMRLKTINPRIKMILCSGFSEGIDTEKALQLQADAFLRKPVSRDELGQVVRRILDEKKE
ncbi:MAG: response regulator, partial [Deltaproteobacteria bacterium]|nr:response regulator [Deltaproteobacteria bacterium]